MERLDILDALIFNRLHSGVTAQRLLQYVGSGLLGAASFRGGWGTALVGLAVHYGIASVWVTVFVLLAQRVRWMFQHASLAGVLYGVFVYLAMNYVVLGFTRIPPRRPMTGVVLVNAVAAIVFCIGWAVGLVNRRLHQRRANRR